MVRIELASGGTATVVAFDKVGNAAELLALARAGKSAAVLLDAKAVHSLFALHSATTRAHSAHVAGTMSSNAVTTEIMLSLAPKKSIANALKTFGIGEATQRMLAVLLPSEADGNVDEAEIDALVAQVQATVVGRGDGETDVVDAFIRDACDAEMLVKTYKLTDAERATSESVERAVLGRMALREVA